jgi:hypothetical protein
VKNLVERQIQPWEVTALVATMNSLFNSSWSEQRQKRRDRQGAQKESNVAIQEKAGIQMGAQY